MDADETGRLTQPPPNRTWQFATPQRLEQCCKCGEPLLPGDAAMVIREGGREWWAHYDSRPCWDAADSGRNT